MANILCCNDLINSIKEYIKFIKLSDSTFSIGYIFYYWTYYKNKRENTNQFSGNTNCFSGYSPHELFVVSKYKSLKEELLNNTIFTLKISEFNVCLEKAMQYIEANIAKTTVADKYGIIDKELYYNIKKGTPLSSLNLLALILYCDQTKLCTAFSSTFRKSKPFESLACIKNRNGEYAHWSRLLRETVEYFGQFGYYSKWNKKKNNKNQHVSGPFFCGMSSVMTLCQFNIRLCGPTSTSRKIEVATRFAGHNGMVLQINNNGSNNSWALTQFNCSWLSKYTGEDEWLYIGGKWPMKLESIRDIAKTKNYSIFIKPLYWFDCMITGTSMYGFEPTITKRDYTILNNLMKQKLCEKEYNKYPKYINDTFQAFTQYKTQIVLNMHYMYLWFDKLRELIMYKITAQPTKESNDKCNLFKDVLFRLFKNVNHIIIHTSRNPLTGYKEYPFNILSLLSLIDLCVKLNRKDMKITINALHKYSRKYNTDWARVDWKHEDTSWIYKKWNKSYKEIIYAFNEKRWQISFEETINGIERKMRQDTFVITKI
eukprot:335003_1